MSYINIPREPTSHMLQALLKHRGYDLDVGLDSLDNLRKHTMYAFIAIWKVMYDAAVEEQTIQTSIQDLSDEALVAEWKNWNDKIKKATNWGAAIAAANGFRKECELEIQKRGLTITKSQIKRAFLRREIDKPHAVYELTLYHDFTREQAFQYMHNIELSVSRHVKEVPPIDNFDYSPFVTRSELKKMSEEDKEKLREQILSSRYTKDIDALSDDDIE